MAALVTKRKARRRCRRRTLSAPQRQLTLTRRGDVYKTLRALTTEVNELRCQLNALHADRVFSGPRHAALCEAISVTERAVESVGRALKRAQEAA